MAIIYVASLLCDKLCRANRRLAACTLRCLFYPYRPTPFTLALAMIRSRFCLRIFILVMARTNSSQPLRPSSPARGRRESRARPLEMPLEHCYSNVSTGCDSRTRTPPMFMISMCRRVEYAPVLSTHLSQFQTGLATKWLG